MSQQAINDKAELLRLLPELMQKVIVAQSHLASIEEHLERSQGAVLRASLPPVKGEPRFTPQFEGSSSFFLSAIEEIGIILSTVTSNIRDIELATQQVVVGVKTQLLDQPADEAPPDSSSFESHSIH